MVAPHGEDDFNHLLELPGSGSSETWQSTLLWTPNVLAMVNPGAAAEGTIVCSSNPESFINGSLTQ